MDKKLEEKFKKYCLEADINITREQIDMFSVYMDFLIEYNKHTNLTSIVNPEEIVIKHFLDSIIINKFIKIGGIQNIIDVGTGAGFPGIPIKICFKNINLTLLDSVNKKVVFLKKLCEKLKIDVDIIHSRAEDSAKNLLYREKFDLVLSRAVAPLNVLSEYCIPYVRKSGFFVSYKGSNVKEELLKCTDCFEVLGGKIFDIKKLNLPEIGDTRNFVIIEKINNCSIKYPRSASNIIKKPL
ncbi:MAG: 16S rRNA (guanine(527)-N(7))-methyltransferase RsmG [Oscillospiraceae bacterium]|jgi:16S rRNA (guanine527-N7)-methyltransferase|nr:16S rRNA (guanine(527)-N(7))-methyltransferase RsmG [Oscillospiraceae bacterium]